jgi:hypothetical protein
MNAFESNVGPTDADLDRLVDGDISARERRLLVARIDASPDGWKRCALAFLEAQAWREALVEEPPAFQAAAVPSQRSWKTPARWGMVAACIAFAFLGGRLSHGERPRSGELVRSEEPQPTMEQLVVERGVRTIGQVAWPSQGIVEVRGVPSMLITVYEGAGIDDRWCAGLPSVLPDLVAKQLERQGCKVREERRLVPLALADGRRLALRVDQLHFTLVGRPAVL